MLISFFFLLLSTPRAPFEVCFPSQRNPGSTELRVFHRVRPTTLYRMYSPFTRNSRVPFCWQTTKRWCSFLTHLPISHSSAPPILNLVFVTGLLAVHRVLLGRPLQVIKLCDQAARPEGVFISSLGHFACQCCSPFYLLSGL